MNQNNQKDLENKGWDAMLQSLDREMPTQKKRRGLLWLWLPLSILALGGGVWWVKTKTIQSETIILSSKTVAEQADFSKKVPQTFGKFQKFPERKPTSLATKPDIFSQTFEELQKFPKRKTDPVAPKNVISNVKTADTPQNNENSKASQTFGELQKFLERKPTSLVSSLPLSIMPDSIFKTPSKPILQNLIKLKNQNNIVHWGITAGVQSQKVHSLDGFEVGLVIAKPINRLWQVKTGLIFRQFNATENSGNLYVTTVEQIKAAGASNLLSIKLITAYNLYYLDLPLKMERSISRKLAFNTGIKPSLLLGESIKKSPSPVYLVSSGFNSSSSSTVLDKISTNSLGLRHFDAAFVLGATYQPIKHFSVGLDYNFGLFNIIKRGNGQAYNRVIGLNATYNF